MSDQVPPPLNPRPRTTAEAEAALRESEERTRLILDHALDAVITMDAEGRITGWNPQAERTFGWTAEEVIGKSLSSTIIPPAFRDAHEHGLRRYLATGEGPVLNRRVELTGWHRSGREFPVELAVTSIQVSGAVGFSAFIRDITDRRRVEEAFRQSEAQYRLMFEANPNPMWVYDKSTLAFLAVNIAATQRYGYSRDEFLGMTIKDIRPEADVPGLLDALTSTNPNPLTPVVWRHQAKDGSPLDVEISAHEVEFNGKRAELVLANDVSRRVRLEEHFRQVQKMEAVGRLAAGIAHDFNNILSAILGYSEILLSSLREGSTEHADAEEIGRAAARAAALTHQILAFSRQQVLEPRVLNLNSLLAGLDRMLGRIIGEDITLETRLAPDLGQVKADPGQLEQVVMNLVINARDAMPGGGILAIETSNVDLDEPYVGTHAVGTPGPFVMLAISDAGRGMSREEQAHIFEPFFTTKEQGGGTGLGLSTVYGIVKQSEGFIWVYSEPGCGSTFKVYLPRVSESPLDEPVAPSPALKGVRPTETILLIEDDEADRKTAHRLLRREGYVVLETPDPREAAALCTSYLGTIHLILTDVVMPGMNGFDLANDLVAVRPDAKVLFMSGYAGQSITPLGGLGPGKAFLEKPFTASILARKVRQLLDS